MFMVLPRRKAAMRQAAHAVGLILADHRLVGLGHEHHRIVGGLQRLGIAFGEPVARSRPIMRRDPEILALHPDVVLDDMVARFLLRIGNLALRGLFENAQETSGKTSWRRK